MPSFYNFSYQLNFGCFQKNKNKNKQKFRFVCHLLFCFPLSSSFSFLSFFYYFLSWSGSGPRAEVQPRNKPCLMPSNRFKQLWVIFWGRIQKLQPKKRQKIQSNQVRKEGDRAHRPKFDHLWTLPIMFEFFYYHIDRKRHCIKLENKNETFFYLR